jgi:hypothetical protein
VRLGDLDALLKELCNSCDGWCDNTECDCLNCKSDHRCSIVCEIADAPTIDPEDLRPKGRWEMLRRIVFDDELTAYRCSNCRLTNEDESMFCPNCGAKMGCSFRLRH